MGGTGIAGGALTASVRAISPIGDTRWDRAAFIVLYELFQVTVTDVSRIGIPITIAK